MFTLETIGAFQIVTPPNTYIYDLAPISDKVISISSDDQARLLDPSNLNGPPLLSLPNAHRGITCLNVLDEAASLIATGGRDGRVSLFDLRAQRQIVEVNIDRNFPVLSLASYASTHALAAGTEQVGPQASVVIWDIRSLGSSKVEYVESHSDDVTVLQYHQSQPSVLLSGSTDGLVNIFNTSITEEEDALYQTINHGSSIHRAGFLSDTDIFALSHDEKLSIYQMITNVAESVEEPPPIDFGDVRERIGCDYAVNLLPRPGGTAVLGTGSHSKDRFDLVQLRNDPPWTFVPESKVSLFDGHGEEVVRSFCFLDKYRIVLTAGEDGQVIAWKSEG